MRVLIVSSSCLPEIDAAFSRIMGTAEELSGLGIKADVLTCLPNYLKGRVFDGHRGTLSKIEDANGITVFRYQTYASISRRSLARLASICSFATTLWCFTLKRKHVRSYDKVTTQFPPVPVAASAMLLFRCCYRKKMVLDAPDLWPLPAAELRVMKESGVYHRVMGRIERFLHRKATVCQEQNKEIVGYIERHELGKVSLLYRNLQHYLVLSNQPPSSRKPFRIVYVGLLGVAQNILGLIEYVDFKGMGAELHLFGGGGRVLEIEDHVRAYDRGAFYHGFLLEERIRKELIHYHASIIPLAVRIRGAAPFKLFDLLPLGVPILLCGGGGGEEIIKGNQLGLVSVPGGYERLFKNI